MIIHHIILKLQSYIYYSIGEYSFNILRLILRIFTQVNLEPVHEFKTVTYLSLFCTEVPVMCSHRYCYSAVSVLFLNAFHNWTL